MMVAWVLAGAVALADCRALEVRGAPGAEPCYRELAAAAADPALRAEALWSAGDVQGANAAFRQAVAAAPDDARVRARWGRLFLDVHQEADAEALFSEALAIDPDEVEALLGLAKLALGRFEGGVRARVEQVLERHPGHFDAELLLARMRLELGEVEAVRATVERLLERGEIEPQQRLDAYAVLAAADAVQDRVPSPWVARALALNARFADVHAVPARLLVINRRYREAVRRYQQAVAVNPEDWAAHAELGINLLRVNRHREARRHLQLAYHGDPYNALTVNTLRLLDLLDGFATVEEPGLVMRAPREQADALAPYVRAEARRARQQMAERYGYTPEGPVVIELYEHHDDFAVRTAGLPGLGILGATFGDVVVMDGPAAKGIADGFDWLSALWHELAHVYTLGATDNRVSRWFSEGVSVMEERQHGPTRQRSVPLGFLEALAEDRLLPVGELDEGFLRPRHPAQVGISYMQAGLLCELIDARFDGGLTAMLRAYRAGRDTAAAVREALGVAPDELDRLFDEHLKRRFGELLGNLETFRGAVREAHDAAAAESWPAALEAAQRAVALYPEYVQGDSAYLPLARAAEALGRDELLDRTLGAYFDAGGRDPWALRRYAARLQQTGGGEQALAVWDALVRTLPLDGDLRAEYGDRLAAAGRHVDALAAYRAALALGPHDRAHAHLRVARAELNLGHVEDARREVLRALELAPRYDAALDLLLELNGER
ncbi:MAG TPA: tetratricopeptide repeat protein [Pseudomonadales bacterium]